MRGCWISLISVPLALAVPGCSGTPLSLTGPPAPSANASAPAEQPGTEIATSSVVAPAPNPAANPGTNQVANPILSPLLNMASLGGSTTDRIEPPVEIYSRIARGALKCWFGTQGSLKKTHVFHADVAPPSAGGGADIAIYERDLTGQSPRSVRAFKIMIARSGEGSNVQPENFRIPETVARDMSADVGRWTQGSEDCSVIGLGGWTARPGAEEAPATSAATKPLATKKNEKTKR